MRITESQLRRIVREEAQRLLEYEQILFRKNGKTYLGNDEGEIRISDEFDTEIKIEGDSE